MKPFSTDEDLTALTERLRVTAQRWINDPDLAEDLAQEALMIGLRKKDENPRNRVSWHLGVLRKLVLHSYRSRTHSSLDGQASLVDPGQSPSDEAHLRLMRGRLRELGMGVPEPYRTPLFLRYLDEMTVREITERLGRPEATVRSQLDRGVRRLRQQLEGRRTQWISSAGLLTTRPASTLAKPPRVLWRAASGWWVGLVALVPVFWILCSVLLPSPDSALTTSGELLADTQPFGHEKPGGAAPLARSTDPDSLDHVFGVEASRESASLEPEPVAKRRSPRLRVLVQDHRGSPVIGGTLEVSVPGRPWEVERSVCCGPLGKTVLRNVHPDAWVRAVSGSAHSSFSRIGTARALHLTTQPHGRRIRGRVIDSGGLPIPGARASLVPPDSGPSFVATGPTMGAPASTVSNHKGMFGLDAGGGPYVVVRVEAPGYRPCVQVTRGKKRQDFILTEARLEDRSSLLGRLFDDRGVALSDRPLTLIPVEEMEPSRRIVGLDFRVAYHGTSDERGLYAFEDVAPGDYYLRVHSADGRSLAVRAAKRVRLEPGLQQFNLACPAPEADGSLTVRFEAPHRGRQERLFLDAPHLEKPVWLDSEDDGRSYSLPDLPTGSYEMWIWSPQYPVHSLGQHAVGASEVTTVETIRPRTGAVSIGLEDLVNGGPAVLSVAAWRDDFSVSRRQVRDPEGPADQRVVLAGLLEGAWTVQITSMGHVSEFLELEVLPGETVQVSTRLVPGTPVQVSFPSETTLVPGETISATVTAPGYSSTFSLEASPELTTLAVALPRICKLEVVTSSGLRGVAERKRNSRRVLEVPLRAPSDR